MQFGSENLSRQERSALALAKAHFRAVAFIEAQLFEPMTVKSIATHAGFSPSRFSRGFAKLQGESPMAYVRGRRLEGAMRRILAEPNVRIVDLAFDCGFDSQEAFTRAFARAFGLTPGKLKRTLVGRPPVRKRKALGTMPQVLQSVVRLPEIQLAGLAKRFSPTNYGEMSDLWLGVATLRGFEGQINPNSYGVRKRSPCEDRSFDFLAAVQIAPGCNPPSPLQVATLPGGRYLRFRHLLEESDLYPQMVAASDHIWSTCIPRSGEIVTDAPDFQIYPADFKLKDGWIDNYFPVQE